MRSFLLAALLCVLTNYPATAVDATESQTAEARGLSIATEADRRDMGFGDTQVDLRMVLVTNRGDEIVREMRQLTLEVADDGDMTILVVDKPRDLKSTAILTHTHRQGSDDQWLYLPAIKRVKRISSADKSGPFMGSEFAYEDLNSQEVEKFNYRHLRDEALDGLACHVVERIPTDPKSGYTRQVAWFDQEEFRLVRIDYYDRKSELLKTLRSSEFRQYLGQYWRPSIMAMQNHQTDKSTTLYFDEFRFQTGLTDRDFDRSSLQRLR